MTLLLPSAERLMQLSFPLAVELSCFFSPSLYCSSVCIIPLSSSIFLSVFLTLCLVVNVPLIAALPVSWPSPLSVLVVVNVPAIVHFLESDLPPKKKTKKTHTFRADCFLPWWLIAMFQSHFAYLNRWFSGITELVNNVLQPQQKSQNDKEPEPDA